MENKNNINVLDELNKGACMGKDAISYILDKVNDKKFSKELHKQYNQYEEICNKINKLYPEYSNKSPHETGTMTKMMTWYGIETKTLNDKSNSKIAELLLQGTNMGIIEGRKLLNHKNVDKKINDLAQTFVDMQEEAVERLKEFL